MRKKYFGTDGIRGTYDKFPITSSFFYDLCASIKKTQKNIKKILIGKDTRVSCDIIEGAIASGFKNVGVQSDTCGVVSTPILSFNTKKFNYDLGVMISASHNPYKDNGIKIFNKNGEKLSDNDEIDIENNITFNQKKLSSYEEKKSINYVDYKNYEEILIRKFSVLSGFKQKIVLDCAHGSLHKIGPKIFRSLDLNFVSYACKPNGKNINKKCGATHPKELSQKLLKTKAQIGISFDGDADRVIFCDENGKIVDGDFILAILARFLKNNNKLKNNLIIGTQMSNLGFRKFLIDNKINYLLSKVGDRYVIEMMKKNDCILGGEQSGHIIFSENAYCGDGIFTALTMLQILKEQGSSLSKLCNNLFNKVPQKLVNLELKNDPSKILDNNIIKDLLNKSDKIENCDVLLRKSGTENLLRLMVQSNSFSVMNNIIKEFIFEIQRLDGN